MGLNPGVGYTGTNLGGVYGLSIDQSVDWLSRNLGRQFECTLSGNQVAGESEYYLQVRKGLVEFDYFKSTENGIISANDLGGINGENRPNMWFLINKFNLFPDDSRTEGANADSDYISDGYIKLEPESDYFVFVYKVTPDWPDDDTLYEAKAPQIGIVKVADQVNQDIRTKRTGGGIIRAYVNEYRLMMADLFGWNAGEGEWQNTALPLSGSDINFDGSPNPPTVKSLSGDFGFKTTDCYRKDLAYIKWNSSLNRFQIFQLNYGPINLRQLPTGTIETAIINTGTGIPAWGYGFDLCSSFTDGIDAYTKDLNQAYYVPPDPAVQIPSYAGDVNIGGYQNSKETL